MTYRVFVEREVHQQRDRIPGNYRQRLRTAITALSSEPRPAASQTLDTSGVEVPPGIELRRLRLDPWRLVYAVHEQEAWIWVLAIRRRPPYDYEDLVELLSRIERG